MEELEAIDHPIIVFGVGLNRFRGQEDFNWVFADHLKLLVQKSAFFGVREKNSIESLRPYLGDLADKAQWQPCPASMLGEFYESHERGDYTVFAPAMDRIRLRGDVSKIVPVLKQIPNLKIALHIACDWDFLQYFDGDVVDLRGKPAKEIIGFYSRAKQVIGMRLHSCLIPFGLGVPVIPLISHDKLKNWLLDIGHPEWGVELENAEKVAERLGKPQIDLYARERMWSITKDNLDYIRSRL
jgi:polysaccharide pyruvyl transferase WcaK-like protein